MGNAYNGSRAAIATSEVSIARVGMLQSVLRSRYTGSALNTALLGTRDAFVDTFHRDNENDLMLDHFEGSLRAAGPVLAAEYARNAVPPTQWGSLITSRLGIPHIMLAADLGQNLRDSIAGRLANAELRAAT